MCGVDRDFVSIRKTLEHRHLTGGQFTFVLLGIRRGDHEQRLLILVRVAEKAFGHRCGTGFQTTGPGRDTAIGISFLLCTHRGQGCAQLGCFLRGNGCHYAGGQQG
ncbi:hypothetical protein D9M73_245450 [compost metagenome]